MILLLPAFTITAQTTITGKVADSKDGSGLSGVTVNVKGTKNSVQTDANGSFRISVPAGSSTIGFTSQISYL